MDSLSDGVVFRKIGRIFLIYWKGSYVGEKKVGYLVIFVGKLF